MTHQNIRSDELDILAPEFQTPEAAAEYLEGLRWPEGRVCPHCGTVDSREREHYRVKRKGSARRLWKCFACRKQFTVTVGTIFEDSHIPLNKWLLAFYLVCSSKKGMSAKQLERMLKVSYKTAWFMCHRIRWAMAEPAFVEKLSGVVEADETYIGGKARNKRKGQRHNSNVGRGKGKAPVMVVVERGGRARSAHVANVTSDSLKGVIREHVDRSARILSEFDFRYNHREAVGVDDTERTRRAILGAEGKRLMYQDSGLGAAK